MLYISMYWHCDICDKDMHEELRNIHLQSGFHKRLANSIIRNCFFTSPKSNKIDVTIRKSLISHFKKYEKIQVLLSVKLLIPSNQMKNIRRQHPCHRDQQCIKNVFLFSKIKIIQEQNYSQNLQLRITFVSRFEDKRFEYYFTKPKSMLEWKPLAMLDKNPENVHAFDYKRHSHPSFQEFF